jgi:hypothetical protein
VAADLIDHRPAFGPPLTHLEGSYTGIVGGAGAYVFWNDMLYANLTFYKGLPVPALQAFNVGNSTTDALANVAPYWRVALEPHWGPHYLMVGTFGMYGQVTPAVFMASGQTTFSTSVSIRNTSMTAINTA